MALQLFRAAFTAVAFLFALPIAQAQDELCYSAGFERPVFRPGQLHGQDKWLNPEKRVLILPIAPPQDRDNAQEIRVLGSELLPVDQTNLAFITFERFFNYDVRESKKLDISLDVQLQGPSTATGSSEPADDDLVSANLGARLAIGITEIGVPSLILSSSGDIYVVIGFNYLHTVSDRDYLNDYYKLGIRFDFGNKKISYFVEDEIVFTINIPENISFSSFTRARPAMGIVNDPDLVNPNDYRAYFDNFCVATDGCGTQCLPPD